MIMVITNPTPTPINIAVTLLSLMAPIFVKSKSSFELPIPSERKKRPRNKKPNPVSKSPTCLYFHFVTLRIKPMPIAGKARLSMLILNPTREIIHPVTVVPIFVPNNTPINWVRVKSPAFTKDITMTVNADED